MSKREKNPIYVRVERNRLVAASLTDSEAINALPREVDLEIEVKNRKRSLPQLRSYWAGLHSLVRATEAYPTAEHLHEAIKFHLGYVKPLVTVTGQRVHIPDSTAFAAMNEMEFKTFLDRAQKLCLETWGFDIMTDTTRAGQAA